MNERLNTATQPYGTTSSNGQPESHDGWLAALIGIFASPHRSFAILRHRTPWVAPLALAAVGTMAITTLWAPFHQVALRAQLTDAMPDNPEQVDAMVAQAGQTAQAVRWLTLATAPTAFAIVVLVQAAFVWLLAIALRGQASFIQSLSLTAHLSMIAHLETWVTFLVVHLRGPDALRSLQDLQPPIGLNLLLRGENEILNTVSASINLVSVWHLALLGLGAATVFGMSRRNGFLLAAIYWASATAISATAVSFGSRLMST